MTEIAHLIDAAAAGPRPKTSAGVGHERSWSASRVAARTAPAFATQGGAAGRPAETPMDAVTSRPRPRHDERPTPPQADHGPHEPGTCQAVGLHPDDLPVEGKYVASTIAASRTSTASRSFVMGKTNRPGHRPLLGGSILESLRRRPTAWTCDCRGTCGMKPTVFPYLQ